MYLFGNIWRVKFGRGGTKLITRSCELDAYLPSKLVKILYDQGTSSFDEINLVNSYQSIPFKLKEIVVNHLMKTYGLKLLRLLMVHLWVLLTGDKNTYLLTFVWWYPMNIVQLTTMDATKRIARNFLFRQRQLCKYTLTWHVKQYTFNKHNRYIMFLFVPFVFFLRVFKSTFKLSYSFNVTIIVLSNVQKS